MNEILWILKTEILATDVYTLGIKRWYVLCDQYLCDVSSENNAGLDESYRSIFISHKKKYVYVILSSYIIILLSQFMLSSCYGLKKIVAKAVNINYLLSRVWCLNVSHI